MPRFVGMREPERSQCVHAIQTQHQSMKMLSAMHDWCHERDGDGYYHLGSNARPAIMFVFSDPDTAFEFRLRWT